MRTGSPSEIRQADSTQRETLSRPRARFVVSGGCRAVVNAAEPHGNARHDGPPVVPAESEPDPGQTAFGTPA